jgi:hypothetical protein
MVYLLAAGVESACIDLLVYRQVDAELMENTRLRPRRLDGNCMLVSKGHNAQLGTDTLTRASYSWYFT